MFYAISLVLLFAIVLVALAAGYLAYARSRSVLMAVLAAAIVIIVGIAATLLIGGKPG